MLRTLVPCGMLFVAAALLAGPASAASTERVSVNSAEQQATHTLTHPFGSFSHLRAISADGRFVAFGSYATNLVTPDANGHEIFDAFVRDRLTGTTERVNVSSAGVQGTHDGQNPAISANGRFVVFNSISKNLAPGDDPTPAVQTWDVFVRDRQAGTTERVSVTSAGLEGDDDSQHPASISADGRYVAFPSYATDLVAGDSNTKIDVFVRDRTTGTTVRANVNSDEEEAEGGHSDVAVISANGRFVAFTSEATNLAEPATAIGITHLFVRDLQGGTTELVSLDSSEVRANDDSIITGISADGRFVAFSSDATNLVANDLNGSDDVFVRDRLNGTTERVSVNSAEVPGNGISGLATLSDNGRYVLFGSYATNLVAGDTNGYIDFFVRDRLSGTTERVNVSSAGAQANHPQTSFPMPLAAAISADGRFVAFQSDADNLVPNDTNGLDDIFVRDRGPISDLGNDLLVDFGTTGLYQRMNNTAWLKIHSASPLGIAAGDVDGGGKDEAIASFTGSGLWARYNNAGSWVRLHTSIPNRFTVGDFDGNGVDDIVADIGTSGLWIRRNNGSWVRLNSAVAQDLATDDLDGDGKDDLIADLGTRGLWVFYNNVTWAKLHTVSPTRVAAGDLDGDGKAELIADFSTGLWARFNNATWTRLHASASQGLAAGDLNGDGKEDLLADFGSSGLWVRYDNSATWTKLHATSPVNMATADLDSSGKADAVIDFGGSTGLWVRYNNATWTKLSTLLTQGIAAGSFD